MNIAFISNVVYPYVKGGAEKRIYEIGRRLAGDHEVTVYCRQFWDGPPVIEREGMVLYGVAPGCELYTDDRRSISEAVVFSGKLLRPLRDNVTEHDVVVASLFPYFPVLGSKLATLGEEVPLVTTWHEVWLDYWEEYLGPLAFGGKLVERITAKTPHYPIAVSGVTADRLASIGPAPAEIDIIANGIDIDQIRDVQPADGYDILFAGRLIADKNVDLLLNAFDRVAADYDITLGIVGDGPESQRLKATAETLTHREDVTFLGFLEAYDDVLAQMAGADIFASPSTREGFGITFAEAMAADCTVIGARHPTSASQEVIGDAGFLAQPTVDSVTATLRRAVEGERPETDPLDRAEKYHWSTITQQAETAYERAATGTW